jgi:hypothetical protein
VKIALIVLFLAMSLFGWYKPLAVPDWFPVTATGLFVLAVIFQIIFLIKKPKKRFPGEMLSRDAKVILSAKDAVYPELEFGDSGAVFSVREPGTPAFEFFKNSHLTVMEDDGRIKVSTTVYDCKGRLVAELVDNEWQINKKTSFDRNFTDEALEVEDSNGDIILQVRLVEGCVQLQGKLYGPNGEGVAICRGVSANGNPNGIIETTGKKHNRLMSQIVPMFRYPSESHLGERLTS